MMMMIKMMMFALYNKLQTTHPDPFTLRRWLTSLTDLWNKQNPIPVPEFLSTFQSKIFKKNTTQNHLFKLKRSHSQDATFHSSTGLVVRYPQCSPIDDLELGISTQECLVNAYVTF